MEQWHHRTVIRDGINLATRRRGNPDGPAVLFVHGYPDNGEVWDAVARALGDDYHLITYDVRGAGASSSPRARQAYRLEALRDDLFAVIDALSPGRPVHLVGHDWGSIQAWEAVTEPGAEKRIASYTSLSDPAWIISATTCAPPAPAIWRPACGSWRKAGTSAPSYSALAPMA